MGIVKVPKLCDYWSNDDMVGQNYVKNKMSRNRFEMLLRMLHFADNNSSDKSDRLYESICVDESKMPFRGRIIFRQYNKQKRHKYGIKVFKLSSIPDYTYKLQIYSGKNFDTVYNTPTNVVSNICQSLLNKGHTFIYRQPV